MNYMLEALETVFRKHFRWSDVSRWSDLRNHDPRWDARSKQAALLIESGAVVLEFGAGRRVLEQCLAPGCKYLPSDLSSRGPDTLICDLNQRPLPVVPPSDVVVFLGVLEYVSDVPSVLVHVRESTSKVILSYACAHSGTLRERIARRRMSWVNDYTTHTITSMFAECGYSCTETHVLPKNQRLFVLHVRQPESL